MKIFKFLPTLFLFTIIFTTNAFSEGENNITLLNKSFYYTLGDKNNQRTLYLFYPDTARKIQVFLPKISLQGKYGQMAVEFPTVLNPFADKKVPGGILFSLPIKKSDKFIHEVNFQFSTEGLKADNYKGVINGIINKSTLIPLGELEINVLSPAPQKDIFVFPVLVLAIGSVLSWFMAIHIPRRRKRLELEIKIVNLRNEIDQLVAPATSLYRKLRRKTLKASEMNQLSEFGAVEERVRETEDLLAICREVQKIENRVETRELIPIDWEEEVKKNLEEVYLNLEEENIEAANIGVNKAFEYFDFDKKTEKLDEFKSDLIREIEGLPTSSLNQVLKEEIVKLKQRAKSLDHELDKVIAINRDFRKLELILQVEQDVEIPDTLKKRVKYLLTEKDDFTKAKELIQIAKEGLDEDYYRNLISKNQVKIAIKGDPHTYISLTFELKYEDKNRNPEQINNTLLATQKFSYTWDLGDGYIQTGKTTVHFFKKPGTYTISLTIKDPQGEPIFTSTDGITVKKELNIAKTIRTGDFKHQKLALPKRLFSGIRKLDTIAFAISVAIATIIGLQTHYIENATFGSLKDYTSLFLWGFSLDSAKNGFLSLMKKPR
ncbi:MAG: PKD domain-containing protein [bacterium]